MFKFFLILSCFFAENAMATRFVGNGGHIVICNDMNSKQTFEVLDLFEAKLLDPYYQIDELNDNRSDIEMVYYFLNKLAQVSPSRSVEYKNKLNTIFNPDNFIKADLVLTPDSYHFVMPTYCKLDQLAIRIQLPNSVNPIWRFSQKYYNQISNFSKAAILLHELIYDELIREGADNSVGVRKLVAHLMSNQFINFNEKETHKIFFESGYSYFEKSIFKLAFYDYKKNQFDRDYHVSGNLKKANLLEKTEFELWHGQKINLYGDITFYDDGSVFQINTKDNIFINGKSINFVNISLRPNKTILSGQLALYSADFYTKDGQKIVVPGGHTVFLDENGYILKFEGMAK